ncbi:cell number regulator 2 [Anaeramoeba flamelloides]|nr:cell number regulator 2 [Anaeramoeba flamelloides]
MGLILPCIQMAKNKADIDERSCTICDCLCMPPEYFTRLQIRSAYGFEESNLYDCIVTGPCVTCAICQDAREIKLRRK